MEKIDFLNCEEFKLIKKLMGISDNDKTNFTIIISADDPNLESTPTGFTYKGQKIILYIRDQVQYGEKTSEYKFHLIDCATLKAMKKQNRYDRYVVSNTASRKFKVNRIINNHSTEIEEELYVCKNCLQKLNWKGYKSADSAAQKLIYENFSVEEFFKINNDDNSGNFRSLPN